MTVRFQERLLGTRQVATPESDQSELVERPAELAPHPRPQLVTRAERLCLGFVTRPRHAQQLGPVHPAPTADATDGRTGTPVIHHLGPLARHVVEREPLRGAHELAVHHPGRERVGAARHQERTDLIEVRQTTLEIAGEDPESTGCDPADHHRRDHTGLRPELDRHDRLRPCGLHVAAHEPFVRARHRHQRVRGRALVPGEQLLGGAQPTPNRRHQAGVHHQVHRHHRRRTRGGDGVAAGSFVGDELLPRRDRVLELAGAVRGLGAEFERRRPIGFVDGPRHQREHFVPVTPIEGGSRCLECGHCHSVTPNVTPWVCHTDRCGGEPDDRADERGGPWVRSNN